MTQPAKRTQTDKVARSVKRQLWILLAILVIAFLVDVLWLGHQRVWAQSLALGASLNYLSQAVFAWFVFQRTGYQARRYIVQQLYRGQMVKWALTLGGFVFIFINIRPLSAPALFLVFILMQISQGWMLWRLR